MKKRKLTWTVWWADPNCCEQRMEHFRPHINYYACNPNSSTELRVISNSSSNCWGGGSFKKNLVVGSNNMNSSLSVLQGHPHRPLQSLQEHNHWRPDQQCAPFLVVWRSFWWAQHTGVCYASHEFWWWVCQQYLFLASMSSSRSDNVTLSVHSFVRTYICKSI